MRTLGMALGAMLALAGCNAHGSCCSDANCWGNYVCSADCTLNGGQQGTCLQRCQIDSDCADPGYVCDDVHTECGCEPAADAGAGGSCPQGANNG